MTRFCYHVIVADGVTLPESRWRIIGSGNLQLSSVVAGDTAVYICTLYEASLTAAASLTVYGMRLMAFEVFALFIKKLFTLYITTADYINKLILHSHYSTSVIFIFPSVP